MGKKASDEKWLCMITSGKKRRYLHVMDRGWFPAMYSCNTGSIRDDPYWTSRKNSLELIELSSINKVSLV